MVVKKKFKFFYASLRRVFLSLSLKSCLFGSISKVSFRTRRKCTQKRKSKSVYSFHRRGWKRSRGYKRHVKALFIGVQLCGGQNIVYSCYTFVRAWIPMTGVLFTCAPLLLPSPSCVSSYLKKFSTKCKKYRNSLKILEFFENIILSKEVSVILRKYISDLNPSCRHFIPNFIIRLQLWLFPLHLFSQLHRFTIYTIHIYIIIDIDSEILSYRISLFFSSIYHYIRRFPDTHNPGK